MDIKGNAHESKKANAHESDKANAHTATLIHNSNVAHAPNLPSNAQGCIPVIHQQQQQPIIAPNVRPEAYGSVRKRNPGDYGDIPDSNMGLACFVFWCCNWCFGIGAMVFASEVNGYIQRGDLEGARTASKSARNCSLVGIGVGVVAIITIVILLTAA